MHINGIEELCNLHNETVEGDLFINIPANQPYLQLRATGNIYIYYRLVVGSIEAGGNILAAMTIELKTIKADGSIDVCGEIIAEHITYGGSLHSCSAVKA